MKIFLLQPTGQTSFLLFDTMVETFAEHGHTFTDNPADCDVCFFDLWNEGGIYKRRDVEAILFWQKPLCCFDFRDQWGSPNHRPEWWGFDDNKLLNQWAAEGQPKYIHLKQFVEAGLLKIAFTRKMSKSWDYPDWVKPIDECLRPDHRQEPVGFVEFYNRPNLACFIGNATPWRANAVTSLVRGGVNVDSTFPYFRLEHQEWLDRHRNARLFVEADGGGFGSERPHQLTHIAAQLRIRNDHRLPAPWTDGVNCIEVGDWMGNVTAQECEELNRRTEEVGMLYQIYLGGIKHMEENYSAEARARYILETMEGIGLK